LESAARKWEREGPKKVPTSAKGKCRGEKIKKVWRVLEHGGVDRERNRAEWGKKQTRKGGRGTQTKNYGTVSVWSEAAGRDQGRLKPTQTVVNRGGVGNRRLVVVKAHWAIKS